MGQADIISKKLFKDKNVFVDLVNNTIFNGSKVIEAKSLTEQSPEVLLANVHFQDMKNRYRDLLYQAEIKSDESATYIILGVENQTNVDYTMPIRVLWYDAMEYDRQRLEAVDCNAKSGKKNMTQSEYLCGFYRSSFIKPVITIVVYFGQEQWDGPTHLHQMYPPNIPPQILQRANNWNINLVEPLKMTPEELDNYTSDLGAVFLFLKYSQDPDALTKAIKTDYRFNNLSDTAVDAINHFTKKKLTKVPSGKGGNTMCLALEIIEQRAYDNGVANQNRKIITKMLQAGSYSYKEIANLLEVSEDDVIKIAQELRLL